jgi:hypothetical protein
VTTPPIATLFSQLKSSLLTAEMDSFSFAVRLSAWSELMGPEHPPDPRKRITALLGDHALLNAAVSSFGSLTADVVGQLSLREFVDALRAAGIAGQPLADRRRQTGRQRLRTERPAAGPREVGRLERAVIVRVRDVRWLMLALAAALAAWGLIDVYFIHLSWWRHNGTVAYFHNHLGFDYGKGLSGLPENFVFNTGNEQDLLRRLVSTFLSPLATAYLCVVALLLAPRTRAAIPFAALAAAGLLWSHTRAALLALAVDSHVDPFVVETGQAGDPNRLRHRVGIRPHQITVQRLADPHANRLRR